MKKYSLKQMIINHYKFIPYNDGYNIYHKNEFLGTSYPYNFKALINYANDI
jgi:hypothetical protein